MYSNNLAVLEDNFKVESGKEPRRHSKFPEPPADSVAGTPKKMTKTGDSGKTVTYYFCPDCGVTLWGVLEVAPGAIIIKIGLTDDPEWSQKNVPTVELYTKSRLSWIDPLEGAVQKETM
jgi:hypothetical protein